MSKVSIPDNIHFYKKNGPANYLPVTFSGSITGSTFDLDRSKSSGKSEVATNLLGLPRAEGRLVLYEDTPQYGFDRNRWEASVSYGTPNDRPATTDPNQNSSLTRTPRLNRKFKRRVDIGAGIDIGFDPYAPDLMCHIPERRKLQGQVFAAPGLSGEWFFPIVYQDADNSSITLEAYPAPEHFSPFIFTCDWPNKYTQTLYSEYMYRCTLKSKEAYRYEPGRVIGFTFGIATTVESVSGRRWDPISQRSVSAVKVAKWGTTNATDSYLFVLEGNDNLKVVRESVYAVNNVELPRVNFIDPLDGTGPSKAKIDFSKVTMYCIEFSWYGAIGATFFVYLPYDKGNTKWIKVAELPSSNTFDVPALADPYMHQYFELQVPVGVTKPHQLRKHGTSVYIDGSEKISEKKVFARSAGVLTPLKRTSNRAIEPRNVVTLEFPHKVGASSVSQVNKNKLFPLDVSAYFSKDVILTISVSRKLSEAQDDGANNNWIWRLLNTSSRYFSYPAKTFCLTQDTGDLFYNGQGSGTSFQLYFQPFRPQIFDHTLSLSQPVYRGQSIVYINVPLEKDINVVARDLLNTHPLMYDDILKNRYWYYGYSTCLRDALGAYGMVDLAGFNLIRGLELLPKIKSVTRTGDRTLALTFERPIPATGDGSFITKFELNELKPEVRTRLNNKHPNYDPGKLGLGDFYYAPNRARWRDFGGLKFIADPLYPLGTSTLCVKTSFYNNQAFCILGARPIDSGVIYYQRPDSFSAAGFIEEGHVEYLKSQNFFKDVTFPIGQTINRETSNIQSYLKENSVVFNTHEMDYAESIIEPSPTDWYLEQLPYVASGRVTDPYKAIYTKWGHYDRFYKLKTNNKVAGSNSVPEGFGFDIGTSPTGESVGTRMNNPDALNLGYEINCFDLQIALTESRVVSENDTTIQYYIQFDDVVYKNKDGVFTSSIPFWTMLLNCSRNLGRYAKYFINDKEHNINFWNLTLPGFERAPLFNLDGSRLVVSVTKQFAAGVNYKNSSIKARIRTITPMFSRDYFSNSLFKDDVANYNTEIIPSLSGLYFWFTLNIDTSGAPTPDYPTYYAPTGGGFGQKPGGSPFGYTPGWRTLKIENDNTSINNKITIVKYDFKDINGAKTTSLNSFLKDRITTFTLPSISGGYTIDELSLSGTSYSNDSYAQKRMVTQVHKNNNNIATTFPVLFTASHFIPANKKVFIDLKPLYRQDKLQILPLADSSKRPFSTFITVKAKSFKDNQPAEGIATINYEEAI